MFNIDKSIKKALQGTPLSMNKTPLKPSAEQTSGQRASQLLYMAKASVFFPFTQPTVRSPTGKTIKGRMLTTERVLNNFFGTHPKKNVFTGDIEQSSIKNKNYRKVLFTGDKEQLVVMSIPTKGDIGAETHQNVDQFFRIEEGRAKFVFNDKKTFQAKSGDAVLIPAGTKHNVINTGKEPLKLYTVYSPPNHPPGTIDKTKHAAEVREGKDYIAHEEEKQEVW